MTQQLTLSSSSMKVSNAASIDKPTAAAVNEGDTFALQLDRQVNDARRPANDKQTNTEHDHSNTVKAEKTVAEDGKNLPATAAEESTQSPDNDAEPPVEPETTETDVVTEPLLVADDALVNTANHQVAGEQISKGKNLTPVSAATANDQSVITMQNKSTASDGSKTTIRADILQAIQSQKSEDGAMTTEKVKSMLQTASKGLQQVHVATAETVTSLRQLEPLTETANAARTTAFGMAASSVSTPAATVNAAVFSLDIQPQLNSDAWNKVMSSRVVWMAREGVQHAELRLNPAHLGPVEVRLSLQNEQANVTFTAANAAARDALEQALPRLRDSFAENGLALNHAEVNHQHASADGGSQDHLSQNEMNQAQVIKRLDDNEDEDGSLLTENLAENSVGVSVFA